VRFDLLLDAGFAADQSAEPGTANMTLAMLDEGTQRRTSLQISEELQRLGASLSAFSGDSTTPVSRSTRSRKTSTVAGVVR
jgi:zinc protease